MADSVFLSEAEVRDLLGAGVSHTTIWRWVRAGSFPKPVQPSGTRRSLFLRAEVEAWVAAQAESRGDAR